MYCSFLLSCLNQSSEPIKGKDVRYKREFAAVFSRIHGFRISLSRPHLLPFVKGGFNRDGIHTADSIVVDHAGVRTASMSCNCVMA